MKNFYEYFESVNPFKTYLKSFNVENNYGTIIIKENSESLKNIKQELEQNYKKYYQKIQLDKNILTIFKNDIKYDCLMLFSNIDKQIWNDFLDSIEEKDLYLGTKEEQKNNEYGLEKESHLTIIYGLHSTENDKKDILDYCKKLKPITLNLLNISIFENELYDVVKIEVEPNKQLLEWREYLIKNFKNTQSFPNYNPHLTIAYVKPGEGKKYCQKLKNIKIEFNEIVYSDFNYKKDKINLNLN